MLKALLKKQFYEMTGVFAVSNKTGKRRQPAALVGLAVLAIYVVGAIGYMFWSIADLLCEPLITSGLSWVYFALTGTFALGISCIGSVFAVKNQLYEAKDNEQLLAMPIKPWQLLLSRMLGLYAFAFALAAVVFVPTVVRYFIAVRVTVLAVAFCSLITLLLPLISLAVCTLLGWVIALITSRVRAKNLLTTVVLILFLVGYFYAYSKFNEYLTYILAHGAAIGAKIRVWLYPFWKMGLAATGDGLAFCVFSAIALAVFALAYGVLSATFLSVVTTKRGEARPKYTEKSQRQGSAFFALLRKETARLFKNPMLAMNCVLGSIMALILPVVLLVDKDFLGLMDFVEILGKQKTVLLLAAAACGVGATNLVASSSVSLEGDTIWLMKALPVSTRKVLTAKTALHIFVTGLPLCVFAGVVGGVLGLSVVEIALAIAVVVTFTLFCGALGLVVNLLFPNLHWTNEVAAAKQGVSALLAMFSNIGVVALLVAGYFWFGKYLPAWGYILICVATLAAASTAAGVWLMTKGVKRFEEL